jgi:hypothetical protein
MKDPKGGWYAALVFESSYSKQVSPEDQDLLQKAEGRVSGSDIPAERKKQLLDYIKLAKSSEGGRFSVVQAEAIVNKFLDGKIGEDHLEFEISLMKAWCGKTLRAFAHEEMIYLETLELPHDELESARDILDQALQRSEIIAVVAISALRVYHPPADKGARDDLLEKAAHLVASAPKQAA